MDRAATRDWAYEEFGHAELADGRRTCRLVRMVAAIAQRPAGKVVEVFRSSAERQAAYDLLSNDAVRVDALLVSIQQAMLTGTTIRAIPVKFTGEERV